MIGDSRSQPMKAEVSELHRQSASGFLCWPMNAIDLAQKDSDLPELIEKLAQFIANWESKGQAASLKARIQELEDALRFYADERRYRGSNQRNDDSDPFTSSDSAYLKDAMRDGGQIARAALNREEGK